MLFKAAVLDAIASGAVTLAFRAWRRPTVRAGGTLTTPIGVLAIQSVDVVGLEEIGAEDARKAGFPDRAALLATLPAPLPEGTRLYRIAFARAGADPRRRLADDDDVDEAALAGIAARLDRLDRAVPWTRETLGVIATHPGNRAAAIAALVGRDVAAFKRDVRKLKALGLTESLEVGYRLTPRGRAVAAALAQRGPRG